jgi:hypothetical protein
MLGIDIHKIAREITLEVSTPLISDIKKSIDQLHGDLKLVIKLLEESNAKR